MADHWRESYVRETCKSMKAVELRVVLATIPIFGRITKLDCVSQWPLPVSNWSDVTLAEALGFLFYAIVLPSPRLLLENLLFDNSSAFSNESIRGYHLVLLTNCSG